MKGDFTRSTFRPEKHYSSVRMQQGRVQLDADWNEASDIAAHRVETETADVIGLCGGPLNVSGFALVTKVESLRADQQDAAKNYPPLNPGDFLISAGRYYVDGILCENEQLVTYANQPDLLNAIPPIEGRYLAYLDVWQRHLTALEDLAIREVALGGLGGPDTATRTKTVWQVKLIRVADDTATCDSEIAEWKTLTTGGSGALSAQAKPTVNSNDPCMIEPGAGYRRLENQLYRVEIHQGGALGTATFKWSRDNGSVVTGWLGKSGINLTVSSVGKDKVLGFSKGDWVELTDDTHELQGLPGTLVKIADAVDQTFTIDQVSATVPVDFSQFPKNPKVRRWDMRTPTGALTVEVPATNNGYIELEDGVQVKFAPGSYRTGDYWLIPARTATGNVEWPFTDPQRPQGILHHYCRLGLLTFDGRTFTVIQDCRDLFPPVTEMTSVFYVGGDGQEAAPGQQLPRPLQVGVANGQWPVDGARVRFTVKLGTGTLQGGGLTFDAVTGHDGVAGSTLTLDSTTQSQQVEATLLNSASTVMHLPVRFSASFSEAGKEPGIHVTDLRIVGGGTLTNDTDIPANEFARGIQVVCDADLEPDAVQRPTCFVTLEMPYPLNDVDIKLWGEPKTIGFQPLVLAASAIAEKDSINWTPSNETGAWLEQRLFQTLTKLNRETRVLARLTILGDFIWQSKSPELFLDGDVFGIRENAGASEPTKLQLPSGDGRRGGKFEMWFWLVPPKESKVNVFITPTTKEVEINKETEFTVTVEGTDNKNVELVVEEVLGGNDRVGTINKKMNTIKHKKEAKDAWIYKAPAIVPKPDQVIITATSMVDRTQTATATVTVRGKK